MCYKNTGSVDKGKIPIFLLMSFRNFQRSATPYIHAPVLLTNRKVKQNDFFCGQSVKFSLLWFWPFEVWKKTKTNTTTTKNNNKNNNNNTFLGEFLNRNVFYVQAKQAKHFFHTPKWWKWYWADILFIYSLSVNSEILRKREWFF